MVRMVRSLSLRSRCTPTWTVTVETQLESAVDPLATTTATRAAVICLMSVHKKMSLPVSATMGRDLSILILKVV